MTEDTLLDRLRATTKVQITYDPRNHWGVWQDRPVNPDGAEAAERIAALEAEIKLLKP